MNDRCIYGLGPDGTEPQGDDGGGWWEWEWWRWWLGNGRPFRQVGREDEDVGEGDVRRACQDDCKYAADDREYAADDREYAADGELARYRKHCEDRFGSAQCGRPGSCPGDGAGPTTAIDGKATQDHPRLATTTTHAHESPEGPIHPKEKHDNHLHDDMQVYSTIV